MVTVTLCATLTHYCKCYKVKGRPFLKKSVILIWKVTIKWHSRAEGISIYCFLVTSGQICSITGFLIVTPGSFWHTKIKQDKLCPQLHLFNAIVLQNNFPCRARPDTGEEPGLYSGSCITNRVIHSAEFCCKKPWITWRRPYLQSKCCYCGHCVSVERGLCQLYGIPCELSPATLLMIYIANKCRVLCTST